jgi:hypothetical protein
MKAGEQRVEVALPLPLPQTFTYAISGTPPPLAPGSWSLFGGKNASAGWWAPAAERESPGSAAFSPSWRSPFSFE